jgi:hypothetical protein
LHGAAAPDTVVFIYRSVAPRPGTEVLVMTARLLLAPLVLFASCTFVALAADEDDPIAAQLLKDKEAFVAAQGKAKQELLKAFDKYYEAVKNNKSLKIEAQLAQLEKIEAEKKAFDESAVPPTVTGLKAAMSEYRALQKKADAACKAAFEKAAKAYRDKGDVKAAAAALEDMKEFMANISGSMVVIVSGHSGKVLGLSNGSTDEGTRVLTADPAKGDPTQLWRVIPAGNGWNYVENVKAGLVLAAAGKDNGTEVQIAKKKDGAEGQLWKTAPGTNQKDQLRLVHKASGKPLVIDVNSKGAGARIILWDDVGQVGEWFSLTPPK